MGTRKEAPLTRTEWDRVLMAVVLRRIPEDWPVAREQLVRGVYSDMRAAGASERVGHNVVTAIKILVSDGYLRFGYYAPNERLGQVKPKPKPVDIAGLFGNIRAKSYDAIDDVIEHLAENRENMQYELRLYRTPKTANYYLPERCQRIFDQLPVTDALTLLGGLCIDGEPGEAV